MTSEIMIERLILLSGRMKLLVLAMLLVEALAQGHGGHGGYGGLHGRTAVEGGQEEGEHHNMRGGRVDRDARESLVRDGGAF